MPQPRRLPPGLPATAFTVSEALALGASYRRMRGRDLSRPFHGVRSSRAIVELRARVAAYSVKMRPGDFASHASALALAEIEAPARLCAAVDIVAVAPLTRPRGVGVRGHEVSAESVRLGRIGGVPSVHPVDAWCQLASELSERELIEIGDALVRRRHPVATLDDLRDAVDRWRGRRGARRLRAALDRVRPRTDSVRETRLRLDAEEWGLPGAEVNHPVLDHAGRLIAYGDLAYPAQCVLVEYDGEQHRTDDTQFSRDVDRLDDLARLGWRIIRVTKRHTGARLHERFTRVREALIERGWQPS